MCDERQQTPAIPILQSSSQSSSKKPPGGGVGERECSKGVFFNPPKVLWCHPMHVYSEVNSSLIIRLTPKEVCIQ